VARNISGLKRGGPGRPKGLPNKVTQEVQEAAAALVDDPAYRERLERDLRARKVAPAIEQMLWYYAKGKPKEIIEHQGAIDVSGLTDADLIASVVGLVEQLDGKRS
jgi:hypothetical protein